MSFRPSQFLVVHQSYRGHISLDHDTTEKMRKIIRSELAACTVVAVAHRIIMIFFIQFGSRCWHLSLLATIIDYDLILVMDQGVIIESGPPRALLSDPKSRFTLLASNQGLTSSTHTSAVEIEEIQWSSECRSLYHSVQKVVSLFPFYSLTDQRNPSI